MSTNSFNKAIPGGEALPQATLIFFGPSRKFEVAIDLLFTHFFPLKKFSTGSHFAPRPIQ